MLHQFLYETQSWIRLLGFIRQEIVYYRSRLAEVVSDVDEEGLLAIAEAINDDFMSQDRVIEFMNEELDKHYKMLEKRQFSKDEVLRAIADEHEKLKRNIQKEEKMFSDLSDSFSGFLSCFL